MLRLIIMLCVFIAAGAPAPAANELVLYNGNIIDTDNGRILPNRTITVKDGIITSIKPARRKIRKGEEDISGKYVIPGLIDSHSHYGNFFKDSLSAKKLSEEYIRNGVTTIRDVGSNYLNIKEYERLKEKGSFHGPDIYYSSIWATGSFRMPENHTEGADSRNMPWSRMFSVKDSTDVALEKAVMEAKAYGCTGFKLYINYSKEDLDRLVPIIKKHGMKVWSHSSQTSGASSLDVAASGTEVMSHAYLIPEKYYIPRKGLTEEESEYVEQVLRTMVRNDVVLDMTLALSYRSGCFFAADVVKAAYRNGVRFVIGTDLPGCEFHNEIRLLSEECGISNLDLLRAATVTGAEILGKKGWLGVISEGAEADIVVLDGNPLEDISFLRNIEMTISDGKTAYKEDRNNITLYNANIVDTETGKVKYGRSIRITDGKIAGISRSRKERKEGETDMSGKFIMPGMIDAHVHWGNLAQDSLMAARLSEDFLAAGVTTVRDLGSNYLNIMKHQEHIEKGHYHGPEVFYCSFWAAGKYFMDPLDTIGWESGRPAPWSRKINVADSTDIAIEKAVLEAKSIGCTGFKLYINYTKDDLARMIPIMKKHGMKVWAHATQVSGATALEMAEAGADVVSHAYMLTDDITSRDTLDAEEKEYVREVCRRLKAGNTVLDITAHISMHEGEMQYCRDVIRTAYEEGVDFVVGTDFFGCAMYEEIQWLKKCGISNKDILKAATVTGAGILGQQGKIGTIRKGAAADLIVMDGNPLEDISNLKRIEKTIISGRTAYIR